MARTKKLKKFWLCRNGHPMYRSEGKNNWRCDRCTVIAAKTKHGFRRRYCKWNHLTEVGVSCKTCHSYDGVPWLRALDETGTGTCPRGHPVSHYDESIVYVGIKAGQQVKRQCRACQENNAERIKEGSVKYRERQQQELAGRCEKGHLKAGSNLYVWRGQPRCLQCMNASRLRNKMRAAVKKERTSPLPETHVDWVVVERLLRRGGLQEHLHRGTHQGTTAGERWVAYCTWQAQHGREPEDGGFELRGVALNRMAEWRDYGIAKKWPRITLLEMLGSIHTEDYFRGRQLNKNAMQRAAVKQKKKKAA